MLGDKWRERNPRAINKERTENIRSGWSGSGRKDGRKEGSKEGRKEGRTESSS